MTINESRFTIRFTKTRVYIRVKDAKNVSVSFASRKNPRKTLAVGKAERAKESVSPTPKDGYYMLKTGETVKAGDFIFNEDSGWRLTKDMIGYSIGYGGWTHGCRKI